jgi:MFS family permease
LSTPLSEHLSLPDHQYAYLVSLLYAVYAVPNTVLPFFAGPAVQRFGERSVLLGTISSIVTGQLLFALSVATKFQPGMIAGRAFIGLGGEMVGVIGCAIVTRWFQWLPPIPNSSRIFFFIVRRWYYLFFRAVCRGKRFSLALAINLCAGRLGSVANTIVIPRFIGLFGIVPATWIATALSLSVVPISTAFLLSVSRPKKVAVLDESERPLLHKTTDDSSSSSIKDGDKGTRFIITLLPPAFWQLALMCVLSYGCVNTFANSAQRFIASRFYAGDQRAAGSAMRYVFCCPKPPHTQMILPLEKT